ncbi:MAG: PEP-CTERM sorting domain-containing protein, partial [Hyphomicrobiales bacterium]
STISFAGSLVSEFLYQDQTNPPEGAWTTLSSTQTSGIWWATSAALGPNFAAANGGQKTLAEWIAGNAGSTLLVGGYNIGVGSGWNGTSSGAIDNIAITSARGVESFNFEVAGVPEPSTWALLILGFGLTGAAMRRKVVSSVKSRATLTFA